MRPFMSTRTKQYDTYLISNWNNLLQTFHEDKQAFALVITFGKPKDHWKYATLKMSRQL